VRKIPALTNNRASKVLIFKKMKISKIIIKKEYVLVWILSSTRGNPPTCHMSLTNCIT